MQSTEQLPCRDKFIHTRSYFTPPSRFLQDSEAYQRQVPLQRSHSSPATARARQQGFLRNVHLGNISVGHSSKKNLTGGSSINLLAKETQSLNKSLYCVGNALMAT